MKKRSSFSISLLSLLAALACSSQDVMAGGGTLGPTRTAAGLPTPSMVLPGLRVGGGSVATPQQRTPATCRVPTTGAAYLSGAPLRAGAPGVARCAGRETFTWSGTARQSTAPAVLAVAQFKRDVARTGHLVWEARTDASSEAFGLTYRGQYYFVTVDNAQYDTIMVVTRSAGTAH